MKLNISKLSLSQLKILSSFFNSVAVAWFSGGIVAPMFVPNLFAEKALFFLVGSIFSYGFLSLSLLLAREFKL